jgi:hypothetical protein
VTPEATPEEPVETRNESHRASLQVPVANPYEERRKHMEEEERKKQKEK